MKQPPETDPVIPSSEAADPRRRVLDLLRRMARATAFGGVALGLASAESCSPIVCDPLPPPITCSNPTRAELQSAMTFTAAWVAGDGGALQVRLQLQNFGRTTVTFSSAVTLTGAALGGAAATASGLTVTLSPAAGATAVTAQVPFDCSGVADALTLTLDVSGTPAAGSSVPVTLTAP